MQTNTFYFQEHLDGWISCLIVNNIKDTYEIVQILKKEEINEQIIPEKKDKPNLISERLSQFQSAQTNQKKDDYEHFKKKQKTTQPKRQIIENIDQMKVADEIQDSSVVRLPQEQGDLIIISQSIPVQDKNIPLQMINSSQQNELTIYEKVQIPLQTQKKSEDPDIISADLENIQSLDTGSTPFFNVVVDSENPIEEVQLLQTEEGNTDQIPQTNLVTKRLMTIQQSQPTSNNKGFENFKKKKSIHQPRIKKINYQARETKILDPQDDKQINQHSQEPQIKKQQIETEVNISRQIIKNNLEELFRKNQKNHSNINSTTTNLSKAQNQNNSNQFIKPPENFDESEIRNSILYDQESDIFKWINNFTAKKNTNNINEDTQIQQLSNDNKDALNNLLESSQNNLVDSNIVSFENDISVDNIISNTQQTYEFRYNKYYEERLQFIKFIQTNQKNQHLVKRYKTLQKRSRYRKNVIKELLQTETSYVQDIQILQEKIIIPLTKLINEQSLQKLFQNIQSILTVNKSMLEALQEQFNVFTIYQATMKVVVDYIAYFKLYYDYCFSFEEFQKTLENLIKNEKEIKKFFDQIKSANTLKGADISSYLIKPIQRLPRYVLLFKDLLKHTDGDHPDFRNITKCCDEFSKINTINNQNIGRHLNQLRMFELQRSFPEVKIINAKNEFIFEEACTLVINRIEKSGFIYAFTYSLLLTYKEENVEKVIINLKLNHLSICKDQGDSQFFHHLISVVGQEDTIQFICLNQESKDKLINDINDIISQLKNIQDHKKTIVGLEQELSGQQIIVHVIGTEERNSTQLKKHTIYITEVRIDNVSIKIFLRYNQIAELEVMVKKKFPKIKIPHFSSMQWLNSHQPKVIEERRILIERFLQILLCSEMVKKDPEFILERLSLPLNFYSLPDQQKNQIIPGSAQELDTSMKQSATKLIRENQDLQDSFRGSLIQYSKTKIIIGYEADQCEFLVTLHLMTGEELQVGFEKDSRVKELKDVIAQHIKLQHSNDFMLFSRDNLSVYRLLNEEEIISFHLDCRNPKKVQRLNSLKNFVTSTIFGKDKVNLVLRKYYYLNWQLEEQDFRDDPIRLKLIVFQALDEIRNEKYILTNDQYCFFAATCVFLRVYLNQIKNLKTCIDEVQDSELHIIDNQAIIQQVIPAQLMKTQTTASWNSIIINIYKQLNEQIRKIQVLIENNQILNKSRNAQCVVDKKLICKLVILNAVKQNPLCQITIFYVECPKETIQKAKKQKLEIYVNIYIGLNYKGLHLLSPRKEIFKSYDYKQIQEMRSYTQEITIKFDEFKDKLSFLTLTGQEIKALMEQYRMLNDFNQKTE